MENKSARAKVQAFGGFLTAMVIPNIGAFIALGFITALFIPTGSLPNEHFAKLSAQRYLFIARDDWFYWWSSGRPETRGGHGRKRYYWCNRRRRDPDVPWLNDHGAARWVGHKYVDKALEKRIPAGFEMVINNFSLGIAGMLLCLLGFEVIGPAVLIANTFVKECIEALVHAGYLPLLSVINEPAKVLFLNECDRSGRLLSAGNATGFG